MYVCTYTYVCVHIYIYTCIPPHTSYLGMGAQFKLRPPARRWTPRRPPAPAGRAEAPKKGGPLLRPQKADPPNHDFWYPPLYRPWNQNVRSLCLCGRLAPLALQAWAAGFGSRSLFCAEHGQAYENISSKKLLSSLLLLLSVCVYVQISRYVVLHLFLSICAYRYPYTCIYTLIEGPNFGRLQMTRVFNQKRAPFMYWGAL